VCRPFQFQKRSQYFIGAHNETLSVAVSVSKRQARLRCRFASSVKAWRLRLSFKHRVKYWEIIADNLKKARFWPLSENLHLAF
jgi:hypothetical protein